jgi:pimeloyl-ACP methyl ester carboxylesterase
VSENIDDVSCPLLLCYPDAGLAFDEAFDALFYHPAIAPLFARFRLVGITPPGMEPRARELAPEDFYPTIEDLAKQVLEVSEHFHGSQPCFGFGIGFGAAVLHRTASHAQALFQSLVLVNPPPVVEPRTARMAGSLRAFIEHRTTLSSMFEADMLRRWFGPLTSDGDAPRETLLTAFRESTRRRPIANTLRQLATLRQRQPFSAELSMHVLAIVGDASKAPGCPSVCGVQSTTVAHVPGAAMLAHLEAPAQLVPAFILFLRLHGLAPVHYNAELARGVAEAQPHVQVFLSPSVADLCYTRVSKDEEGEGEAAPADAGIGI